MIICPNCHHRAMTGSLFCEECGATLVNAPGSPTRTIAQPDHQNHRQVQPDEADLIAAPSTLPLAIKIVEAGQIVPLAGKKEFTIGRAAEGQPIVPDIDLSPYQGFEKGLSRLHATIKVDEQRVVLIDLGSVNGTRLNGVKIKPYEPHPLKHGDIVNLGKMKIQLLIQS